LAYESYGLNFNKTLFTYQKKKLWVKIFFYK